MITLLIFLALTKFVATIEILSLLLVAAIIGYVTAWLYYKSVYARRMKISESEMDKMNNKIGDLNADKRKLEESLKTRDEEIKHLNMQVSALRALHTEAVHETDEMKLKNERSEQLLYEKDEAMTRIAQRAHLLDYNSFGTATEAEKDDLRMISGIGPYIEERLHALNIYTFRQISNFTTKDIETIDDAILYFSGRIQRDEWVTQARELADSQDKKEELLERIRQRKERVPFNRIGFAKKEEADDLTVISGIGGWINEKLNAIDIFTFGQISNFTEEDVDLVTEVIEYFPGRIERDEWILQARELVRLSGKKSELLKRIRDRKEKIYTDRLGVALKHEANNLTLIRGIGLWIEERLNLLDIYTFKQVSKLTAEDVKTIAEILEFPPDRITRDNWVGQARELAKTKVSVLKQDIVKT